MLLSPIELRVNVAPLDVRLIGYPRLYPGFPEFVLPVTTVMEVVTVCLVPKVTLVVVFAKELLVIVYSPLLPLEVRVKLMVTLLTTPEQLPLAEEVLPTMLEVFDRDEQLPFKQRLNVPTIPLFAVRQLSAVMV